MRDASFVFLAGIGNSEPEHWQRLWYEDLSRNDRALWVEHADWNRVSRGHWVTELDSAIDRVGSERQLIVVAHSLGCLLAAEWMDENPEANVLGALFVAPPDLKSPAAPTEVFGFRDPLKVGPLGHHGVVVASEDDPYATLDYARQVAAKWGAKIVEVGKRGHINVASGLGRWPEGRQLLTDLLSSAP
jgi:predicted alpha/beta hydrolase family esterase